MKLAIPKESRPDETRVAATPETVKKLIDLGFEVTVEKGAGAASSIPDALFKDAGAKIAKDAATALADADVVFKVLRPTTGDGGEVGLMKGGAVLAAIMAPFADRETVDACAAQGVQAFAMELMPRITRAQSMDVLSSQSNLAGYRAVIDGAYEFGRAFPMMMTAAGTVAPARVVVMGAGVAGLQAIATARRLGAVVSAFDVRPVAKEQVESLGAKFIEVESPETAGAETAGGYAREMSEEYQAKQREVIHETLKKSDIVITTALIPGKPAPLLVTKETVAEMRPGSVIVDLASEAGGNCELTEHGKIVTRGGVRIVGHANVPGRLASNASALYAKNLLNFVTLMVDKEKQELAIDWEDEIITGTALTRDGKVVHLALTGEGEV
jgi:NAD(P) transhydrogenase subunit alpha